MRTAPDSIRRRDRLTAAALFAGALAIYLATSSAHLVGGDNAEFVTIFARGGVAHPPGFPLYCILLRLCAWMPGGPALGSSRVSAVIGACAVGALYRACRAWGGSSMASFAATTFYALSPLAWRLSTQAEVFALNALFAALLLYFAAPSVALAPARRVLILAALAGLAYSDHPTIVLLAPVGLLAAVRALRDSPRPWRVGALAVITFGVCLLPYLYCYEVGRAPNGRYVWGEPGTVVGLVRHLLRDDYGTLRLAAGDRAPDVVANVALSFAQTANHTLVLPLLIGGLGFWRMLARRSTSPGLATASPLPAKRDALFVLATWALAGPVFAACFNIVPEGLGATVVERFRLLPEVVFTIAFAWGLDAWRGFREGRVAAVALTALAVVGLTVFDSWPQVRAEHTDALEVYTANTERSAPPDAVILGTGDYRLFSFIYADAMKLRPDVTYIDPNLLNYDWYRERAGRLLGAPIPRPVRRSVNTIALVDQAFALGRPVVITDIFVPQIVQVFPSYPLGTVIRLLPRDATLPAPDAVESENLAVFSRFQRSERLAEYDPWASAVLPTYQRPWIALSRMFERRGDEARAKVDAQRAEEWRFSSAEGVAAPESHAR